MPQVAPTAGSTHAGVPHGQLDPRGGPRSVQRPQGAHGSFQQQQHKGPRLLRQLWAGAAAALSHRKGLPWERPSSPGSIPPPCPVSSSVSRSLFCSPSSPVTAPPPAGPLDRHVSPKVAHDPQPWFKTQMLCDNVQKTRNFEKGKRDLSCYNISISQNW